MVKFFGKKEGFLSKTEKMLKDWQIGLTFPLLWANMTETTEEKLM